MVISTSGLSYIVWVNFDYAIYTYAYPSPLCAYSPRLTVVSRFDPETTSSSSSPTMSSSSSPDLPAASASHHSSRTELPATSASHHTSDDSGSTDTAVIVAATTGGVALLIAVLTSLFVLHRRRRRHRHREKELPPILNDGEVPPQISAHGYNTSSSRRTASLIDIDASSTYATTPRVANPSNASEASATRSPAYLRRTRQQTLRRQMRAIEDEMSSLSGEGGESRAARDEEMSDLRTQIATMRGQLEALQSHLGSAWAQGLSDEPPPGYTAAGCE